MQRGLRTEEFEEQEQRRELEFTLGPVMLLGILCGLLLLGAICFGMGYSAGRRSAVQLAPKVTQTATGQTMMAPAGTSLGKPPARGLVPPAPQQVAIPQPPPTPAEANGSGNPFTSYAPLGDSSGATAAGQPAVRPALPAQSPNAASTGPAATNAPSTQAVPAQGPVFMVQVAAVSHQEDAAVLMNALRKRGYTVMARKGFSDGLIHIQVGPFSSRGDADGMSHKLLNDGYNAVVLP